MNGKKLKTVINARIAKLELVASSHDDWKHLINPNTEKAKECQFKLAILESKIETLRAIIFYIDNPLELSLAYNSAMRKVNDNAEFI